MMEWYLTIIQTYLNIKAVLAAVALTSFIKYVLPSPEDGFWARFNVRPGPVLSRVVPFLPVVIAFVWTYLLERDANYTFEDAFRGIMSGAFAGHSYKLAKTAIFGE